MTSPRLLFYCQHALGLGHLVRSLAVAEGLTDRFDVTLLNGGRMPAGVDTPSGVQKIDLPPLGYDRSFRLISHDPTLSVEQAQERRCRAILDTLYAVRPHVVLIELYPFGRSKFAFELEPLLDAVGAMGPHKPRVICSVRDILVNGRAKQIADDNRVVERTNGRFDAVLVHADPTFVRLEESFRPSTPLEVPVHYTGFVVPTVPDPGVIEGPILPRVLVSAGGGTVGGHLFDAAVSAHRAVADKLGLTTTIVTGPFLPDGARSRLEGEAAKSPALEVVRQVDDLMAEMRRSRLSVSQGGYNTTFDILRARVPALVIPFSEGGEDEQVRRSERLAALGVLRTLAPDQLCAPKLVEELSRLAAFRPRTVTLDLTGRETTARIIADIAGKAA